MGDVVDREAMRMLRTTALCLLAAALAGCTSHLLSRSNVPPSNDRPVVRIETKSGVEFGAATDHGLLFLGRTATEGPCRVHYFLGGQLFVEDGYIEPAGGVFYRAVIDLKHQRAHFLGRELQRRDRLLALVLDGDDAIRVPLDLSRDPNAQGDVAHWPGRALPPGTPVFIDGDDDALHFVGLVAAEAVLEGLESQDRFVVFTGTDRLREMLLYPTRDPKPRRVKHRNDGISIVK